MVVQQNEIKEQIKRLDIAISELDDLRKVPLITTFIVKEAVFNHYLEIQGNVTTKDLLVIYPEFSGILTHVYIKEGQWVKKGQVLGKIDDGGLSQQLAQLNVQVELAKTTFERQQRLWDQKIGSEMQYLQAKSNYEAQTQAISELVAIVERQVVGTTGAKILVRTFVGFSAAQNPCRGAQAIPAERAVNLVKIELGFVVIVVVQPTNVIRKRIATSESEVEVVFIGIDVTCCVLNIRYPGASV